MANVILSGEMTLLDLTNTEELDIKNALSLPNPVYENARKYSKSGYTSNIPEYLFYYHTDRSEPEKSLKVPVGFDASDFCYVESVVDQRIEVPVDYPSFMFSLRKDQEEACSEFIKYNIREHLPTGLIQLPTGKGKTILGIYLAYALQQKTLVLVHKNDLMNSWKEDIKMCFNNEVNMGVLQGKQKFISPHITVAMIQTLNRWSDSELSKLFNQFGLVITDEVHHCPSSSYAMVSKFNARYKLGLSATPERADGLTSVMKFYFGDFAYKYTYQEDDEDILPVKVILRPSQFKFRPCINKKGNIENLYLYKNGIQVEKQDLSLRLVESIPYERRPDIRYHMIDSEVLCNQSYIKMVVNDIKFEYNKGRSCVAFFSQKEMCKLYYDVLSLELGRGSVQLFYGDSVEDDKTILDRAEKGECRITLTTYSKGTEGTNCKAWEVAFLVSSVNNEKNVEQAVGRVRRIKEGKIPKAIVYDYRHPYVYAWHKHGVTRDNRYKALKFDTPIVDTPKCRYTKGYNR